MDNIKKEYSDPNDNYSTIAYILPDWIKSNCKNKEEYINANNYFYLIRTDKTGDCLFHSIHLCLISIMGTKAYTTYELRYGVAQTILENNEQTTEVINNWYAILKYAYKENDKELIKEYKHAQPLIGGGLTNITKQELFQNMLNKNIYWGDQYSIMILEQILNVKLIILYKRFIGQQNFIAAIQTGIEHSNQFDPEWYMILCLDNNHYMPIVKKKNNKEEYIAIFKKEDIPPFINRLL